MARVVWTREALANVELIRVYLREFDPAAAGRVARRLIEAGDSLTRFPDRGRPTGNGRRELVTVSPYIIRYRVIDDVVYVLRVRHGAQQEQS